MPGFQPIDEMTQKIIAVYLGGRVIVQNNQIIAAVAFKFVFLERLI